MSYLFGGTPFDGYSRDGRRSVNFGGGGGGSQPSQTTATTYQTNIPDYAQPYVESMLGATQQQLFNVDSGGNITGIKPYVPYSEDPTKYIAPFSPLQQQAQRSVGQMTTPGQFGAGSSMVGTGGTGTAQTASNLGGYGQYAQRQMTSPYMQRQYMSPYIQNALQPSLQEMQRQYDITGAQERGKATGMGAFGGTRQALMQAENERNKNIAMNKAIGEGYQQAFTQGQAAQEKALGMGLQGLQGAQSGYGQLGTLGTQLGQLGTQQFGAEQGIANLQAQLGAQQQTQQQNIINQAIQNYAMQQQYPQQQLAFMNAQLRGLPLQSATTSSYQAAPSTVSQLAGLGLTGASMYGMTGGFGTKKKGGVIKERKDGIDTLGMYNAMKGN
jgi:hypothetical protein